MTRENATYKNVTSCFCSQIIYTGHWVIKIFCSVNSRVWKGRILGTLQRMALSFVLIGNGGSRRKVLLKGFGYTLHRKGKGTFWHCERRTDTCKGRLWVSDSEHHWEERGNHNHQPDFGKEKAAKAKNELKRRVREKPNTDPATITQQIFGNADEETLSALPKENSLKRTAQRTRREGQPELPTSLDDLVEIPERYRQVQGENWLLHDNGPNAQHRLIVFARPHTLRLMSSSTTWFGDGTFKTAPSLVRQIYTIHFNHHENVVLGVAALMENKSKESYRELFQVLKDALPEARRHGPVRFSTDFELGASLTFQEVFPNSEPAFCFFHFAQSLWRKAADSGVSRKYQQSENEELRNQFHAILGLAFVPPQDVPSAFDSLQEHCLEDLQDVLQLLEIYYVLGKRRGRGRQPPIFKIESWNVYQRTTRGIPRTNNSVEAWNRRFNTIVSKVHPNVFAIFEELQSEEAYSSSQKELIDGGASPPKKKKRYMQNDDKLKRLCDRYEEISSGDENGWEEGILRYMKKIGLAARGIMDYIPIEDEDDEIQNN